MNRLPLLITSMFVVAGHLCGQSYLPDPRALGLASATTSTVEGIHAVGYNPARLAFSTNNFSMNVGGLTLGLVSNMLNLSTYNLINGADMVDTTSVDYVPKSEVLALFPDDGFRAVTNLHMPIPALNWARGTTAFSSEIVVYGDMGLPKSFFEMMWLGNELGLDLDIDLDEEAMGVAEWGFSFAVPSGGMAFGMTIKYLQGLFYMGIDSDSSSGYFMTDSSGFVGEGRYLIRQAVGGSGIGLDLGFATEEVNGFQFGISLINALGSIKWNKSSITKELFGETIQGLMPWRENEYFLYTYNINEVTALDLFGSTPLDSLFNKEAYTVIDTENGLVRSDTMDVEELTAAVLTPFVINYPSQLRMGISQRFEGDVRISVDLMTGFQDRFWSKRGWQLALGVELLQIPSFPLRLGLRYGGANDTQLGMGFGIHKGPLHFDTAIGLHNGLWLHTLKGISFALGFTLER